MRAYEFLSEAGLSTATFADEKSGPGRLENFINRLDRNDGQNGMFDTIDGDTVQLVQDQDIIKDLKRFPPEWPKLPQKNNVAFPIQNKNNEDEAVEYILLSKLQKTKDFGSTGSKKDTSERQEHGMINIIKNNAPVTIEQMGIVAKDAYSYEGMNSLGKEQYIDIMITDTKGKDHGISMKATQSMTIGGGGTAGIMTMTPKFLKAVYKYFEKWLMSPKKIDGKVVEKGWEDGAHVPHKFIPEFYFVVPKNKVETLIRGNKAIGGPIDFIYTGPADVTGKVIDGKLNLDNGTFKTVKNYAKDMKGDFYLRIRRRDVNGEYTEIDYSTKGKAGLPILMKNQSNNRKNWRLLMTQNKPDKNTPINVPGY